MWEFKLCKNSQRMKKTIVERLKGLVLNSPAKTKRYLRESDDATNSDNEDQDTKVDSDEKPLIRIVHVLGRKVDVEKWRLRFNDTSPMLTVDNFICETIS